MVLINSRLCPWCSIQNRTWYFRNWICFCPQMKRWWGTYSAHSIKKILSESLEQWKNFSYWNTVSCQNTRHWMKSRKSVTPTKRYKYVVASNGLVFISKSIQEFSTLNVQTDKCAAPFMHVMQSKHNEH
jgi:hypothetical protein